MTINHRLDPRRFRRDVASELNSLIPETGTFTPTVLFGGGSTGVTYSTQAGTYVKVGPLMVATADIVLSSKGTDTGSVGIGGWPGDPQEDATPIVYIRGGTSGISTVNTPGLLNATADRVFIRQDNGNTDLTDSEVTNSFSVMVTAIYETG